jgi:hypothetical protein
LDYLPSCRLATGDTAAWASRATLRKRTACPVLQHDPNRPEDVLKVDVDEDGNGGDDTADALRYLIASKGRTVAVRKLVGA